MFKAMPGTFDSTPVLEYNSPTVKYTPAGKWCKNTKWCGREDSRDKQRVHRPRYLRVSVPRQSPSLSPAPYRSTLTFGRRALHIAWWLISLSQCLGVTLVSPG
ncbi:hypothetical protein GDO78_018036 [Eleutherodactylus coqui]|uniref:Uncharacterized protein n=1 Tax=Eleutherodactylus coqui TaxID=57060 RepID=A0A8J6E9U2_ELECQ|nr:hypothetical protein GDO78_018036 [Eleutherodactylus coqui]